MRRAGIQPRRGQGFPWTYGPGDPALPQATRHGYTPPVPLLTLPGATPEFPLLLTGNPYADPRPRGPIVSGPDPGFPLAATTGRRLPGGQGTDMTDESTWQRPYVFTPAGAPSPVTTAKTG